MSIFFFFVVLSPIEEVDFKLSEEMLRLNILKGAKNDFVQK